MQWGRLITCPNRWLPTPIPPSAPVPPAHALPQWVVSCPNVPCRAALGARWAVFTAIPTRRGTLSQRCLRFHSATTLCKCYNACKVWYPFENSASLANQSPHQPNARETLGFRGKVLVTPQRARLPFENTTSLAKHPEPPALDHSALRDKGTSSASTSPARSWANADPHWGRKRRIGVGERGARAVAPRPHGDEPAPPRRSTRAPGSAPPAWN